MTLANYYPCMNIDTMLILKENDKVLYYDIRLRIIIARCYYLFDNYHEYGIFHCIVHKKKHQLKTNKLHRLINDDVGLEKDE